MKMYSINSTIIFCFIIIKVNSILETSNMLYIVNKDYRVELNENNLVVSLISISSYKTQINKT